MKRTIVTPRRVLSAALLWLAVGALALLAVSGRGPVLARAPGEIALVLPAIPIYLVATGFETARSNEGALWVAVHGPPFLKPQGVAVVYFLPASIALLWMFARWVKRS